MSKTVLRGVASFVAYVLLTVAIIYALNFWWWNYAAPERYLALIGLTQNDALFLEGLVLVILGFLLVLGRGGINLWSVRAAVLGAAADAVYGRRGRRAPGPAETLRRDAWKPSGFVRLGLVLMFAGVILIVLHLL